MALTKEQRKDLHKALLSAFPDVESLSQMVSLELDKNLAVITDNGPLDHVVLKLVQWAEASGRTDELVSGALRMQPLNPELRSFLRHSYTQFYIGADPHRADEHDMNSLLLLSEPGRFPKFRDLLDYIYFRCLANRIPPLSYGATWIIARVARGWEDGMYDTIELIVPLEWVTTSGKPAQLLNPNWYESTTLDEQRIILGSEHWVVFRDTRPELFAPQNSLGILSNDRLRIGYFRYWKQLHWIFREGSPPYGPRLVPCERNSSSTNYKYSGVFSLIPPLGTYGPDPIEAGGRIFTFQDEQ